jgi:thiamine pyrophosphate-dependent acetolactate synthase large subunit-like protein
MGNYEKHMPIAIERFNSKTLTGDYSRVADALGVPSQRVAKPNEIVPAIRRGLEVTATGRPALLEFITCEEPAESGYDKKER